MMEVIKTYQTSESINWLLHSFYIRSDFDQLEQLTESQHSRQPSPSDYALYLRGFVQLRTRSDVKSALRIFTSIRSTSDPLYVKALARCLTLLGQHAQVVGLLKENALLLNANDWQLWNLLGCELLHLFDLSAAKEAFQHALQTTNQTEPFVFLSQCHLLESDPKSAIFVLRRAIELAPDHTDLTIRLGLLLYSHGQKTKGTEKLMQLQHLSARKVGDLRLSLAVGSVMQEVNNDIDQALFRYRLADCSDSPALWNNVALCLAAKGRLVAAVCCLKRSVYLSPLYWPSQHNLALIQLQLKQHASAFHHLKCAAALTGGQCAPVLSLLATCLELLQDLINSRSAHQAAVQAAQSTLNPLPLINFAIFLHNNDFNANRAQIIRLLQQFEQSWIKRNRYAAEFDQRILDIATHFCSILQLDTPMAWMKPSLPPSNSTPSASLNLSTQHADC